MNALDILELSDTKFISCCFVRYLWYLDPVYDDLTIKTFIHTHLLLLLWKHDKDCSMDNSINGHVKSWLWGRVVDVGLKTMRSTVHGFYWPFYRCVCSCFDSVSTQTHTTISVLRALQPTQHGLLMHVTVYNINLSTAVLCSGVISMFTPYAWRHFQRHRQHAVKQHIKRPASKELCCTLQ